MTRHRPSLYEAAGQAMLRAAVHTTEPAMPPWPTHTAPAEEWRAWLSTVWSDTDFRRTVSQASPHLVEQVQAIIDGRTPKVRRMRRAALSTARYAIRYARRSTPYGLFAGVAPLDFDQATSVRIGDEHQAVARPEPVELEEMLSTWESDTAPMADAEVCVNTLIRQRDQHIHVPSEGDAEFRLALNPALRLVLDLARSPIGYRQLSDKLAAEFPAVSGTARDQLLGELLQARSAAWPAETEEGESGDAERAAGGLSDSRLHRRVSSPRLWARLSGERRGTPRAHAMGRGAAARSRARQRRDVPQSRAVRNPDSAERTAGATR
ncbi:lantibiotic dehydratase [Streptomyces sp. NPDC056956]|uniref:lantibiotic dehydratase n=1 Tax=Streptomyces sp. NPDC056956 TaxID=3345980 RepID=UPI0036290D43